MCLMGIKKKMINFNDRLKYDLGLEDNMFNVGNSSEDVGLTEELAVFGDETTIVEDDLASLEKTEIAVHSLESIRVSLESIINSNVNDRHAVIMVNASLESIEMTFGLTPYSISLEDESSLDSSSSLFGKVTAALSAVKNGAFQLLGKIGQSIAALFGSVVTLANKFKSKLNELKSKADAATGDKSLKLGKAAINLVVETGAVDGSKYIKDLSNTMKTMGVALNTFKTIDELTAISNAIKDNGKFDAAAFDKKYASFKTLEGNKVLGGKQVVFKQTHSVEDIKAALDYAIMLYREIQEDNEMMASLENDDTAGDKRASWKLVLGWLCLITSVPQTATIVGLPFAAINAAIGHRLVTGKWGNPIPSYKNGIKEISRAISEEAYTISMESVDTSKYAKQIHALMTTFHLSAVDEVEVMGVKSLDSKQVIQVVDMLGSLADNVIAYANTVKSREKAVKIIGTTLKKLEEKYVGDAVKTVAEQLSMKAINRLKNTLKFEMDFTRQLINVIRGGTAYIEASVK